MPNASAKCIICLSLYLNDSQRCAFKSLWCWHDNEYEISLRVKRDDLKGGAAWYSQRFARRRGCHSAFTPLRDGADASTSFDFDFAMMP